MNKNQTYRAVTAYILVVLIAQIFVLQGIHHIFGHHHHDNHCEADGIQLHEEGHTHSDCDICTFQLAPTQLEFTEWTLKSLIPVLIDEPIEYHIQCQDRPSGPTSLRGPPALLA